MYRTITDLKFCTLEYDATRRVLRCTWRGFFASEMYRLANEEIADFAKSNPVVAIVSDVKDSGMVKAEDQAWVAEHILPQLVARGLKYVAFVMPASIFAELSLKNFSQKVETAGPVSQRHFGAVPDAEQWVTAELQPA